MIGFDEKVVAAASNVAALPPDQLTRFEQASDLAPQSYYAMTYGGGL